MPKIITVTPHTAVDHVVSVPEVDFGGVIRATSSKLYPSGKGVNVARALAALGRRVIVMGFLGSETPEFNTLDPIMIQSEFTLISGKTRLNTTLLDASRRQTMRISTTGFSVTDRDISRLGRDLESSVAEGDVVVFAGSLPDGAPGDLYQRLIRLSKKNGGLVVLDACGEALTEGVQERPHMIKPNSHELEDILGYPVPENEAQFVNAIWGLVDKGIELVVASDGARGAVFASRHEKCMWHAHLLLESSEVLDSAGVGSGDAMVAGCVISLLEKKNLADLARYATACAAANVTTHGPSEIDPPRVAQLEGLVTLRQMH